MYAIYGKFQLIVTVGREQNRSSFPIIDQQNFISLQTERTFVSWKSVWVSSDTSFCLFSCHPALALDPPPMMPPRCLLLSLASRLKVFSPALCNLSPSIFMAPAGSDFFTAFFLTFFVVYSVFASVCPGLHCRYYAFGGTGCRKYIQENKIGGQTYWQRKTTFCRMAELLQSLH